MGKVNFANLKKTNVVEKNNVEKEILNVTKTKKISIVPVTPKKKVEKQNKIEQSESEPKFEPQTSWYRGVAELLKGSSVRGTKLHAIQVMIKELKKREQKEILKKKGDN
jgi:hypothetical protein